MAGGQNEAALRSMVDFINGPGFIAGLIATVGNEAYIGKAVLTKQFEKAGIV